MTSSNKPTAQAKKEQTVAQAIANVDAKKEAIASKPKRPNVLASGKGAHGHVMFNKVPDGFMCAAQLATAIDIYFDMLGDGGHRPLSISAMQDYVEADRKLSLIYETQSFAKVLKHYAPEIAGKKPWKYKQGTFAIGELS